MVATVHHPPQYRTFNPPQHRTFNPLQNYERTYGCKTEDKSCYRNKVRQLHPDKNPGHKQQAHKAFLAFTNAKQQAQRYKQENGLYDFYSNHKGPL